MKKILAINGSATANSSNLIILKFLEAQMKKEVDFEIWEDLSLLPHFQTELTEDDTPPIVNEFRRKIANADGVIICSPEYIFSIPARLKNGIEWCVSTTVFTDKPVGIIIASASGKKALEELTMIMTTVQAKVDNNTTLLIDGVKGKVGKAGIEDEVNAELILFAKRVGGRW